MYPTMVVQDELDELEYNEYAHLVDALYIKHLHIHRVFPVGSKMVVGFQQLTKVYTLFLHK
jgi:hypothetical protein